MNANSENPSGISRHSGKHSVAMSKTTVIYSSRNNSILGTARFLGKQLLRRRNQEMIAATVLSLIIVFLVQTKLLDNDKTELSADLNSTSNEGLALSSNQPDADSSNPNAHEQNQNSLANHERLSPTTIIEQLPFSLDDNLQQLLLTGGAERVTDDLLLNASEAVARGEYAELGRNIALLGSVTLLQRDTESAAIYLQEALEIFEQEDDELGIAGVELLRGQLNIEKRWQAREAAYAYDAMQIAGWKIAHDRFPEAEAVLHDTIQSNLDLNRYGAAAAGYEALFRGYDRNGQPVEAMNAGIEAAKLHAASGRQLQARQLLKKLETLGIDDETRQSLRADLRILQTEYEQGISQIGSARDYAQLYHHYINDCLLYTSPSPRDATLSRMPSSA